MPNSFMRKRFFFLASVLHPLAHQPRFFLAPLEIKFLHRLGKYPVSSTSKVESRGAPFKIKVATARTQHPTSSPETPCASGGLNVNVTGVSAPADADPLSGDAVNKP